MSKNHPNKLITKQ